MTYNIAIAVRSGLEQPQNQQEVPSWYAAKDKGWFDDKELAKSLIDRGHVVAIVDWEDAGVDFGVFDGVFVSSTWNGCHDPQKYLDWLDRVEADGKKRLINGRVLLTDNFIKAKYMVMLEQELKRNGSQKADGYVTPSVFYVEGTPMCKEVDVLNGRTLESILSTLDERPEWGRSNIVMKPMISADGVDTFVYNRLDSGIKIDEDKKKSGFEITDHETAEMHFARLAQNEKRGGVIIQPYIKGVEEGEYSLTFFENRCYYAIHKPKLFRGDRSTRRSVVALPDLPPKALPFAQRVIDTMTAVYGAGEMTRARVDLFVENGTPVLCELECVDPNTNFRVLRDKANKNLEEQLLLDNVFERYAEAVERRVQILTV